MKSAIYRMTVEFGDCDPANIVFYPNFYRWFNASSSHLFRRAGVTPQDLRKRFGVTGIPVRETGATYLRPATYGDELEIETSVAVCSGKQIRLEHRVRRDGTLLVEGFEARAFTAPHPDDPRRLRAIAIPDEICAMLGHPAQTHD